MGSPSQPVPYSAELQAFILAKYDPLLSIVRELNDRLEDSERERTKLGERVRRLEEFIRSDAFTPQAVAGGGGGGAAGAAAGGAATSDPGDSENDPAAALLLDAPWLFSCRPATPSASLQALLQFAPDTTVELDVPQWTNEEEMWFAVLEDLPVTVKVRRLESLGLNNVRNTARQALIDLCKNESLFILRGVPGKDTTGSSTQITLVAVLVTALSEAWNRVQRTDLGALGRLAVVLEGSNLGTRLRAGKNKFTIEPLQ